MDTNDPQYFRPYAQHSAWHIALDMDSRWVRAECGLGEQMIDTEWAYEPPRHWRMCEGCKARVSEEREEAA